MREFAKAFYQSKQWRTTRKAFIQSVNYQCNRCPSLGDIVHHKIRLTPANINDPNATLNWDNLELLCLTCHNTVYNQSTADGLKFDENGNLIG